MAKVKRDMTQEEAKFIQAIGYRCAYYRKKKGLSQEQLAEAAGISAVTLSHFESSNVYPLSLLLMLRLAKSLDIELWQLLKID